MALMGWSSNEHDGWQDAPRPEDCGHPDGVYLYDATDEDGNELVVYRCTECGQKYIEGA